MLREDNIPFSVNENPLLLEIETTTALNTNQVVDVYFLSSNGATTGAIYFYFRSGLTYSLLDCTGEMNIGNNVALTGLVKIWRIELSRVGGSFLLVIHCNKQDVIRVVLTSSFCGNNNAGWLLLNYNSKKN